jgi:tripartite-type tricarboxylate transporter receptor subunit TctC
MVAPAGLPRDIQLRLQNAAMKAVKRPDVAQRLLKLGFDPVGSTATDLAAAQKTASPTGSGRPRRPA